MARQRPSRFLIAGALCLVAASAPAQPAEEGARAAGLAGGVTALPGDTWGRHNAAAWATLGTRRLAFLVSEGFGMRALRTTALHYVQPAGRGALAAGARTFGFEDFRASLFTAGYARNFGARLGPTLYGGAQVGVHRLAIPGYGTASAVDISLGLLATVTPLFTVGLHAGNLSGASLAGGAALARTLAIGAAYRPEGRVILVADARHEHRSPLSFRSGLEYTPVPGLALRGGVATSPRRLTLGAGLAAGLVTADVAVQRHTVLGWTPTVELGIAW